jgi:hypothetical protein
VGRGGGRRLRALGVPPSARAGRRVRRPHAAGGQVAAAAGCLRLGAPGAPAGVAGGRQPGARLQRWALGTQSCDRPHHNHNHNRNHRRCCRSSRRGSRRWPSCCCRTASRTWPPATAWAPWRWGRLRPGLARPGWPALDPCNVLRSCST